ncbi:pre-miRNA 5'-monophosphate methyltransferase-like [Myxocyprinus asiaticus]|uniref:pre-miRNA 5'-monophosphate methyltransferase-like n=1 Tax=Myxocyprinus asiaticus TaxID=70543 RepID=UPI002222660D|nr:pre-miRNA 5'-monophosphate methyltransferase-like [Myxocyprinus asiaticus]
METHVSHVNSEEHVENQDPEAAPYGNFINYDTFNPPEYRVSLISESLLEHIGCGSDSSQTVLILDVGCNSRDLSVALYKHLLHDQTSGSDSSKREVHVLGFDLDQDLILRAQNSNPLPQDIQFIPLDITDDGESQTVLESYLERFGCARFHLCTCFAVTMSLLSRLASLCEFLQSWNCYRPAAQQLHKLGCSDFEHFETLAIHGDMAAHA